MPRPRSLLCAIAIGAASLGLLGCGGDDSSLLGSSTASALNEDLDRVGQLAADGRCADASRATKQLRSRVSGLPRSIDADLRRALATGVDQLQVLTNDPECGDERTEEPTETKTQPETQPAPEPTKTQEQPPAETTPPEEEPPAEEPEDDGSSGGTPPPLGDEVPPAEEAPVPERGE